jgi:hypothetical protein
MYPHGSGYADPAAQLAHLQAQMYAQQYAQVQASPGAGVYGFGYGQPGQAVGVAAVQQAEGRVIHVSNINASATSIAHLFNLFSLCGSVARIKFVYTNTSQALIEYEAPNVTAIATANPLYFLLQDTYLPHKPHSLFDR